MPESTQPTTMIPTYIRYPTPARRMNDDDDDDDMVKIKCTTQLLIYGGGIQ